MVPNELGVRLGSPLVGSTAVGWGDAAATYRIELSDGRVLAAHRIGAIVTTLYLAGLFVWLWLRQDVSGASKRIATGALVVLLGQVSLGVSNVVFDLPLAVAVAHNGVAALLMMFLIMLTFSLYHAGSRRP